MNYVREMSSRYRMPDFSKLWRVADEADGASRRENEGPGLAVRLEAWVVRFQGSVHSVKCLDIPFSFVEQGFFRVSDRLDV